MGNIAITNIDNASLELANCIYEDDTLYSAGVDTIAVGTILARKAVATAVTVAAGTNTGTGTCTAASVVAGPAVPLVGAYVLTCITAVAHGGVFKLVDPNGSLVSGSLAMTAGAGAATVFEVAGLTFTLTDANDFIVGDSFTLTVAADGKLGLFAPGGAAGLGVPVAVLPTEVVFTGAASKNVKVIVGGEVRFSKLIIDADGSNANVTSAVRDSLRMCGITSLKSTQLSIQDNQ